jgi:ferrous iron transport protein B
MPTCHEQPEVPAAASQTLTIALAGNPNSGKTTLFNALTGLRQKVANYPGVTVEKKTGRCKLPACGDRPERWIDVIDLPGTYSLISRSPDEHVAMEVLRGLRSDTRAPDVVVVVVDASNLQRNLYLVSQLIELGRPMVVALNMTDIAERRGMNVSAAVLSEQLGVPVVAVVGHKRKGVDELKAAISRAAVAPLPAWPVPEAMREELLLVAGGLSVLESETHENAGTSVSAGSPNHASDPLASSRLTQFKRPLDRYEAIAERLLIGDHAGDVAPLMQRPSVAQLLDGSLKRLAARGIDPMQADIEAHYKWIDGVTARTVTHEEWAREVEHALPLLAEDKVLPYSGTKKQTATEKVDAVLIHKVWGLVIFALVMAGLFVSIFWAATPIMDAIKNGIKDLGTWTTGSMPEGALKSLLQDGVFNGVGAVVVFVPQIAMLFCFLAILEDSGYLARAAFLMDRLLSKVGLSGKSFIPLLSSFACAIPGIMATRTIENRRDRLATIFIAPFMSCSARLPVYALLIGAFFAGSGALAKGGILLACYALGIIAAVITAWMFKRSFMKGPAQAFILELPSYKIPQASQVARVVWSNTSKFLTKAGTVIFCLSVILWAMSYYPRLSEQQVKAVSDKAKSEYWMHFKTEDTRPLAEIEADIAAQEKARDEVADKAVKAAQSEISISGHIGHFIEPAIRPLGFNWKMGVGLVSAFAAREVFVSSMGIVYSVGEVEDDTKDLSDQMMADRYPNGAAVWTPLVAVSVLVWFVLAMQCMSTLAIVRRETGGWKWPIVMLVYMNLLAYVVCLGVYQIGSALHLGTA